MEVAQKRLLVQGDKKKKAIIQKNINRVMALTYGFNSSIVLRGILDSLPDNKKRIPALVRIGLEGIEALGEQTLSQLLDDLESEWKPKLGQAELFNIITNMNKIIQEINNGKMTGVPMTTEEQKRASWWSSLSSDDEEQISDRICVVGNSTNLKLNLKNPIVEFKFDIINATVFRVEIGRIVKGRIIYGNEKQSFDAEITPLLLFHGNRISLTVTQRLFPEIARNIQEQINSSREGADIYFGFQTLQIGIAIILPDGTPLKSNRDWYLSINPPNIGGHFTNINML